MNENVNDWLNSFRELNPDTVAIETKKSKDFALPIATVLSALDKGDKDFYERLSDDEKKGVSIWLLMRWMSSTKSSKEHYLMMTNDIVNYDFNNISKHPELQWKLLSLCGIGKIQYHEWIAPPKGFKKNKVEELLSMYFPLLKEDELELLLNIHTEEELVEFLKDNGYDDKSINEIFKRK